MKLSVELVPETCWYSNVRSEVASEVWDRLRRHVYAEASKRCEICGGRGPKWPVECHEVWHYDDERHVQTLVRMIALCPNCHEVKHFGYAQIKGRGDFAFDWLRKVNNWTPEATGRYLEGVAATWDARSVHKWELDLSVLDTRYGDVMRDPNEEIERAAAVDVDELF